MMKNVFIFLILAVSVLKKNLVFILNFWSCRKNSAIRKIRSILKFMTSQHG